MNNYIWESAISKSLENIDNSGYGIIFNTYDEIINKVSVKDVSKNEIIYKLRFDDESYALRGAIIKCQDTYYKFIVENKDERERLFSIVQRKNGVENIVYKNAIYIEANSSEEEICLSVSSDDIIFQYLYAASENPRTLNVGHVYISSDEASFGVLGSKGITCINFDLYNIAIEDWEFDNEEGSSLDIIEDEENGLQFKITGVKDPFNNFGYIYRSIVISDVGKYTLSFKYGGELASTPKVLIDNDFCVLHYSAGFAYTTFTTTQPNQEVFIRIGFVNDSIVPGQLTSFIIYQLQLESGEKANQYSIMEDESFFSVKVKNDKLEEKNINPDLGTLCLSFSIDSLSSIEEERAIFSCGNNFKSTIDASGNIIFTYGNQTMNLSLRNSLSSFSSEIYHLIYSWRRLSDDKMYLIAKVIKSGGSSFSTNKIISQQAIEIAEDMQILNGIYGSFDNLALSEKILGESILDKIATGDVIDKGDYIFYYNFSSGAPAKQDSIKLSSLLDPSKVFVGKTTGELFKRKNNLLNGGYSIIEIDTFKYAGECDPSIAYPKYPENKSYYKVAYNGDGIDNIPNGALLVWQNNQWRVNKFQLQEMDICNIKIVVDSKNVMNTSKYRLKNSEVTILGSIMTSLNIIIYYIENETFTLNYNNPTDTFDIELSNYTADPYWKNYLLYNPGDKVNYRGVYYRAKVASKHKNPHDNPDTWSLMDPSYGLCIYYDKAEKRLLREAESNPLLNSNNNGFLTVTQKQNMVETIDVSISPQHIRIGQTSSIFIDCYTDNGNIIKNADLSFKLNGEDYNLKNVSDNIYKFTGLAIGTQKFIVSDSISGSEDIFEITVY